MASQTGVDVAHAVIAVPQAAGHRRDRRRAQGPGVLANVGLNDGLVIDAGEQRAPEAALAAAAHDEHFIRKRRLRLQHIHGQPQIQANAFQRGARHVGRGVAQRQTRIATAHMAGAVQAGAAGQAGVEDQLVAARRGRGGQGGEEVVNVFLLALRLRFQRLRTYS